MCERCQIPAGLETRRSFVRQLAGAAALAACPAIARGAVRPAMPTAGFGRLVTPMRLWNFHRDADLKFLEFLKKESALPAPSTVEYADPERLENLCAYPVLFTNNLVSLEDHGDIANLREYLFRGGFIYVEECLNQWPDFNSFRDDHMRYFQKLLPRYPVQLLQPKHPLYSAHFIVDPAELWNDGQYPRGEVNPLFGIYDDDRLMVLLSLAHLFCGWGKWAPAVPLKLRLMANIYAYALQN